MLSQGLDITIEIRKVGTLGLQNYYFSCPDFLLFEPYLRVLQSVNITICRDDNFGRLILDCVIAATEKNRTANVL